MSNSAEDPRGLKAAALKYNNENNKAPIVVASGNGFVAQKIIEIADLHGIAVYHDDNAASLLTQLELGQEIPMELYEIVVDIYINILKAAENSKPTLDDIKNS